MTDDEKREIILEHYQNPLNKRKEQSYKSANSRNESCIDNIDVYVDIENDIIKDITFDGEACAISISSTSIMIETLIGKTVEEAKNIIENFDNMINEKEYNKDVLQNAIVYSDIYKQSSRKKCAFLPYKAIKKILDNY